MRSTRLVGLALTCILIAVLLVIGLRPDDDPQPGEPPQLRNGRVFIQDNLWSTATHQYAVWVGADGTPYAGRRRRDGSEWSTVSLAKLPGNPLAAPTADDEHNVYAIGVDARGGVHVAGNMHDDPLRYAWSPSAELGRWRSEPAPASGDSVTYPAFVGLPDGTLLFWRREGIAGNGAIVLDALDDGAGGWRSLGTILDGRPTDEGPYLHHVAVDPRSGTIHLLFEWRSGRSAATNSDVGYARSSDGGRTWERSDGTPIELPITHASAETVIDTAPSGIGLLNGGGLTVDAAGAPHGLVAFRRPGIGRSLEHVWLDDGEWRREELDGSSVDGRPQLAGTPDGRVWMIAASGGALVAVDVTPDAERAETRELARVPLGWEASIDSQALARHGVVETLVPEGDRPHVVAADLADP